jgi:hypothetical protein
MCKIGFIQVIYAEWHIFVKEFSYILMGISRPAHYVTVPACVEAANHP